MESNWCHYVLSRKNVVLVGFTTTMLVSGCAEEIAKKEQPLDAVHHLSFVAATEFAAETSALRQSMQRLCNNYSESQLQLTQSHWQQAMQTWMSFQGREKGGESALALSWQIQFWPDKKNTTGHKLKQLLKQNKSWTAAEMKQQSVSVQGLGAVEWFLFQQPQQLSDANYCQLASAITEHVATTGTALVDAWQDNPWQHMPNDLALSEYLGAINNQLDRTIKKLTRPMAKVGKPKPYQAEAWRSQTSMLSLKASVEALHTLYLANGEGLDALLRERGYSQTADRLNLRFELLLDDWPQSPSMVSMLKTKSGYRDLINVFNGLEYIQLALLDEVAPELGITVGFNATDGD